MDQQHFQELEKQGYTQYAINLPQQIETLVIEENWSELDRSLGEMTRPDGIIHQVIQEFTSIHQIEYIIAIRRGPDDEEGIWHDDGSRKLAYTLSLTRNLTQLKGGVLQFRKKGEESISLIPTAPYGTLTIFKTGQDGYEHCVQRVSEGVRIISAGWIT